MKGNPPQNIQGLQIIESGALIFLIPSDLDHQNSESTGSYLIVHPDQVIKLSKA
jgi:hypothetical protein